MPANAPAKDQSTTPLPSSGPYMIKSYAPNKKAILVRNPNFNASDFGGNVPSGNPDMMTIDIIGDDTVALQRVISGQDDYDFHQIPPDRLASTQQKYGDQIKVYTPANTYYFFMNNRVAPFDNLKVRQAVNYAINREALVRIYGGLGQPTENVLPPTYPQYQKLDMYPYNLAKAKQLIQASGDAGAEVTVWNHDRGTDPKATAYLVDVLNSIGLKAKREDHQLRRLLDDRRQPGDEGTDRLRRLVPGLSASARLVRRAAERRPDHGHAQQQLRELRRQGGQRQDRGSEEGADPDRLRERSVGPGRQDGRRAGSRGRRS